MIIAIKGTIGSGKTTVAKYINQKYGFEIINGDEIVKELYLYDKMLINKVNSAFNLEGEVVDKKKLAEIVFNDESELAKLEEIVHPVLSEIINTKISQCQNALIDAQVIDKLSVDTDCTLIIAAKSDDIVKRVMKRDERSEESIRNIIKLQSEHFELTNRTYVINNDNLEKLNAKIDKVMKGFYDSENWKDSQYSGD